MQRYAVFGNPVAHSLSPVIHAYFAKVTGRDIAYTKILVPGTFKDSADAFFKEGGCGCNITMPCKQEAFAYADRLSDNAKAARAVNTLKKEADGTVSGYNTDGPGLMLDLQRLECPLKGAHVLIIGAGGAAQGILRPLMQQGCASISIVNRTAAKAAALAAAASLIRPEGSGTAVEAVTFEELQAHPEQYTFEIVINASSSSVNKAEAPLPDSLLSKAAFAYDLMYSTSGDTVFTQQCRRAGVNSVHDGMGMLVCQAALSFEIWQGVLVPPVQAVSELASVLRHA